MPDNGVARDHAHEHSEFAVIDPAYAVDRFAPEPDFVGAGSPGWFYGDAEMECWQLHQIVEQGFAAAKNVHYARNYHRASTHGVFRLLLSSFNGDLPDALHLRAVGDIHVSLGGVAIYQSESTDTIHAIEFPAYLALPSAYLEIEISTENEPPAILILAPSDPRFTPPDVWFWSADGFNWTSVTEYSQTRSGYAPHLVEEPTIPLKPIPGEIDGLFDFGREIFWRVHLASVDCPKLSVGESIAEALETDDAKYEQRLDLAPAPDGGWVTRYPLGFGI